jgi:hypothetical protein
MSGCTFQLARNSPLRTTLVDQATGLAKYQIDTPIRISGSVTRIRKLDSSTHPFNLDDADSDSDDDSIAKGVEGKSEHKEGENDGKEHEAAVELPETSDEIARIYWRWFSSDKIVFHGKITTQGELLPKCGKMKG